MDTKGGRRYWGMNWEIGTDKDVGEFVISSVLSRHNKNLK